MNNDSDLILNLTDGYENFPNYFKRIYDKKSLSQKKQYIRWIDNISKYYNSNIYWWSLTHVSKNNYINNNYHYFVILETLKTLRNSKKFNILIIDEILKDNIYKLNFKYKTKIITVQNKISNINYLNIAKFICLNIVSIMFFKIFSKKNFFKSNLILIDCFIYNYKNSELGFIKNISTHIKEKNYFFVPTFAYISYFKRLLFIFKNFNNRNYLFKEHFLNLSDLLDLLKIIKFSKSFNRKILKLRDWDFSKIIYFEMNNFSQYESIFSSLLNYKFFKNLKKNGIDICKSINYFENQNLDKGWNLGFNTFYNGKQNIGYQAFNYLPMSFNISPSCEEIKQNVCPKEIIVKGKGFIKIISENCKKIIFKIGPSFKYFDKKKFNSVKKIDYLFLLTGIPKEDKKVIDRIFLFKDKNSKKKIALKPHPISKLSEDFVVNLKKKKILLFEGDVERPLQFSDVLICSGLTTSLIEALIFNCKIIMYSDSVFDKFFFSKLNIPSKSYIFVEDLNNINKFKLQRLKYYEKLKIINNYFSDQSHKSIKNLI